MGEYEAFEVNTLWDREPVWILEERGDVLGGTGVSKEACCRVLDELELVLRSLEVVA